MVTELESDKAGSQTPAHTISSSSFTRIYPQHSMHVWECARVRTLTHKHAETLPPQSVQITDVHGVTSPTMTSSYVLLPVSHSALLLFMRVPGLGTCEHSLLPTQAPSSILTYLSPSSCRTQPSWGWPWDLDG